MIETGGRLLPIEVKATRRPSPSDARHLSTFLSEYPDQTAGALLLHAGETVERLGERIVAAPWWRVI